MAHEVRGVVARAKGQPVTVESIVVPDPGPGEALVDVAIAGAVLAGATTIVAVYLDERKLEMARRFGATHTVNAGDHDPVEAVRAATGGFGADVCIEAVGNPKVLEQAFFGRGGALKPSWYGDCLPSRDFPLLIDLYLQGRLPLDRFVSERIGLEDIEEAFHKMEKGLVLRSVAVL